MEQEHPAVVENLENPQYMQMEETEEGNGFQTNQTFINIKNSINAGLQPA